MPVLSNRKLAYSLTVLAYRECNPLEDYHSEKVNLNMQIYAEIYNAVKKKMDEYKQCISALRLNQDEFWQVVKKSDQSQYDNVLYFLMVAKGIHMWLPAKAYTGKISQDIVEYMLAGTFKQYCSILLMHENEKNMMAFPGKPGRQFRAPLRLVFQTRSAALHCLTQFYNERLVKPAAQPVK